MPSKDTMLSVAEVCELQPGDEKNATWINPGFTGVVRAIEQKNTRAGKMFWPCTIGDTTGSATIEVSFFTAPKFKEGDQIELSGKGLRRTEYNGNAQAAIGKDTAVHVLGKSVHHEEQKERSANLQPAVNGSSPQIPGVSVGCALNQAWETMRHMHTGEQLKVLVNKPEFWGQLKQIASDHLRVSTALEHGKVSAPSWRQDERPEPRREEVATRRGATEEQMANRTGSNDEDVPF